MSTHISSGSSSRPSRYRISAVQVLGSPPISFILQSSASTLRPFLEDIASKLNSLLPPLPSAAAASKICLAVNGRNVGPRPPDAELVAACGIYPGSVVTAFLTDSKTPTMQLPSNANSSALSNADSELADAIAGGLMLVNFNNCGIDGYLVVREVPADNNCLFHAVSRASSGADAASEPELVRLQIASYIQSCPELTSLALLGHPSIESYFSWISRPSSWGGEIEVTALSRIMNVGIYVIDVRNRRINRYVPPDAATCLVLIYSGVHYDYASFCPEKVSKKPTFRDISLFPLIMPEFSEALERLAALLFSEKKFSDTSRYVLKCDVCSAVLNGNHEATEHANQTACGVLRNALVSATSSAIFFAALSGKLCKERKSVMIVGANDELLIMAYSCDVVHA